MKGQIYILVAILIVITLTLIGVMVNLKTSETFLYEKSLNLKNELIETVDLSLLNREDVATNLDSFITFSTDIYSKRGFTETVTYTISSRGGTTTVNIDLYLGTDSSFIQDNFVVERDVYSG